MGQSLSCVLPKDYDSGVWLQKASIVLRKLIEGLKQAFAAIRPFASTFMTAASTVAVLLKRLPECNLSTLEGWGYLLGSVGLPLSIPFLRRLHDKLIPEFCYMTSDYFSEDVATKIFYGFEIIAGCALFYYLFGPETVMKVPYWTWKYVIRGPPMSEYAANDPDRFAAPILHFLVKVLGITGLYYRSMYSKEVQARVIEEAYTAERKLVPVYSSQYASLGQLNHHIIIVHNQKHELRKTSLAQAIYQTDFCPIEEETLKRARVNGEAANQGKPRKLVQEADQKEGNREDNEAAFQGEESRRDEAAAVKENIFHVYLIGWTTKTHDEIKLVCEGLMEGKDGEDPWKYHAWNHNCQDYVRAVADVVVEDKSAVDWEYFRVRKKTPYQRHLFDRKWLYLPVTFVDWMLSFGLPGYAAMRR